MTTRAEETKTGLFSWPNSLSINWYTPGSAEMLDAQMMPLHRFAHTCRRPMPTVITVRWRSASSILFVLPGVIALMTLSVLYAGFGNVSFVQAEHLSRMGIKFLLKYLTSMSPGGVASPQFYLGPSSLVIADRVGGRGVMKRSWQTVKLRLMLGRRDTTRKSWSRSSSRPHDPFRPWKSKTRRYIHTATGSMRKPTHPHHATDLWGWGYHRPGGAEHFLDLVKPFGLDPGKSMMEGDEVTLSHSPRLSGCRCCRA